MPGPGEEEEDDELEDDEDDEDDAEDDEDDDDEDDGPIEASELIEQIVDCLVDMDGIENAEVVEKSAEITMDDESVWRLTLRKVR